MNTKKKLSKGILEMKFMKKTKEKVLKEDDDAKGREMYSNEYTEKMLHGNLNYIVDPSYIRCEDLIEGRYSCRGMNPELEKMLENEEQERLAKENGEMQKDVSDKEMTKFYGKVVKTISNKFAKRRHDTDKPPRGKKRKHNVEKEEPPSDDED